MIYQSNKNSHGRGTYSAYNDVVARRGSIKASDIIDQAVTSETPFERLRALTDIPILGMGSLSPTDIKTLCETFFDVHPKIRQTAVEVLTESVLTLPYAAPCLCELLSFEEVRENKLDIIKAISAIGKQCNKAAPKLLEIVDRGEDTIITRAALEALTKLDTEPGPTLRVLQGFILRADAPVMPELYVLLRKCGSGASSLIPALEHRFAAGLEWQKVPAAYGLGVLGVKSEKIARALATIACEPRNWLKREQPASLAELSLEALCLQGDKIGCSLEQLANLFKPGTQAPLECVFLAVRAVGLSGQANAEIATIFKSLIEGPKISIANLSSLGEGRRLNMQQAENLQIEMARALILTGLGKEDSIAATVKSQAGKLLPWSLRATVDYPEFVLSHYSALMIGSGKESDLFSLLSKEYLNPDRSRPTSRFPRGSLGFTGLPQMARFASKEGGPAHPVVVKLPTAHEKFIEAALSAKGKDQNYEDFLLWLAASLGPVAKPISPRLLELAKNAEDGTKYVNMLELIAEGNEQILPELCQILPTKNKYVVLQVCRILKAMGPVAKEARNELTLLLFSEDNEIRKAANETLKTIGADDLPDLSNQISDIKGPDTGGGIMGWVPDGLMRMRLEKE